MRDIDKGDSGSLVNYEKYIEAERKATERMERGG
jgi:hypothetical protein